MMTRRRGGATTVVLLSGLLAGPFATAVAQVTATRPLSVAAPVPTETVTLTPRSAASTLAGKNIGLSLGRVNLDAFSLTAGLYLNQQSNAIINSFGGATSGTYSVKFVFTWVNGAATIAVKKNGVVIAQCSLHSELIPVKEEQTCDTGFFDVTDGGNLSIEMAIASGYNVDLKSATVTYGPLNTIRLR